MMLRFWAALYPVLRWMALALLILLLTQAMPFDPLAILFAGDILAYLEVAAAVLLVTQVTRAKWAAVYTRLIVQRTIRRARVRARRFVRRIARLRPPSGDEDRPAPALAYA